MRLTLEYWPDDGGYVGRLREIPGIFSQGDTRADLEENIRDAYELVIEDARAQPHPQGSAQGDRGTCVKRAALLGG